MSDQTLAGAGDELKPIQEHLPDVKVAPAHGIAAIALSMALKYHDISTVQDGALYQQYKLEGKNMTPLHLDMVFETAMRIELHLMASEQRIAKVLVEALEVMVEDETPADEAEGDDSKDRPEAKE